MHKAIKLMAVSLNLSILILFAFFTMSLMEEGKAGNMAEAVTTGTDVELIEDLTPQLIGNDEQAMCMALNIYYESRSDNLAGQYAVADVVLNRVHDDRYPDTVCEVITQGPVKESWKMKDIGLLTVNTNTLDHPNALPLYQKVGFDIVRSKTEIRKLTQPRWIKK